MRILKRTRVHVAIELAKLTPPNNPSPTMDAHLTARAPKTDHMLQYEYARSAFRLGLDLGVSL